MDELFFYVKSQFCCVFDKEVNHNIVKIPCSSEWQSARCLRLNFHCFNMLNVEIKFNNTYMSPNSVFKSYLKNQYLFIHCKQGFRLKTN